MDWVWLVAKILAACGVAFVMLFLVGAAKLSGEESERERQQFGEDE